MRAVWLSGAAALLLFAALAAYLAPLRPGVLELQFAFTPATFGAIVHSWSAADLARYRAHFGFDFVLLTLYGAFGWLCATRAPVLAALSSPWLRAIARWALPAAAAFDASENVLHLWLTAAPRFGVPHLYAIAAGCAALKWTGILGFALLAAFALARRRDE